MYGFPVDHAPAPEQLARVEDLSDAFHLRVGERDVLVAYLLEITAKGKGNGKRAAGAGGGGARPPRARWEPPGGPPPPPGAGPRPPRPPPRPRPGQRDHRP